MIEKPTHDAVMCSPYEGTGYGLKPSSIKGELESYKHHPITSIPVTVCTLLQPLNYLAIIYSDDFILLVHYLIAWVYSIHDAKTYQETS